MDEKSGFYLTVTSDSSMKEYENNRTSAFSVNLAKPLTLSGGSWEIGLAEVIYPMTIENVTKDNNNFIYEFKKISKNNAPEILSTTVSIPLGHYSDISDIINILNHNIKLSAPDILEDMFSILPLTKKIKCNKQARDLYVTKVNDINGNWGEENMIIPRRLYLQPSLALMFGLNPYTHDFLKVLESEHLPSIKFGFPSEILLYIDIVTPILFGNR